MSWFVFLFINLICIFLLVLSLYMLLKHSSLTRIIAAIAAVGIFLFLWWLLAWDTALSFYYYRVLESGKEAEQEQAISNLHSLKNYDAVFNTLGNKSQKLRDYAFSVIKQEINPYHNFIKTGIDDKNPYIRLSCFRFVWEGNTSDEKIILEKALSDPFPMIRSWAIIHSQNQNGEYLIKFAQAFQDDIEVTPGLERPLAYILSSARGDLPLENREKLWNNGIRYLHKWVESSPDIREEARRQKELIGIVEKIPHYRSIWFGGSDYGWITESIEGNFPLAIEEAGKYLKKYIDVDPQWTLEIWDRLLFYTRVTGDIKWLKTHLESEIGPPMKGRFHPYQIRTKWLEDSDSLKKWWQRHTASLGKGRVYAKVIYDGEGISDVQVFLRYISDKDMKLRNWSFQCPLCLNGRIWEEESLGFEKDIWGKSNSDGQIDLDNVPSGKYAVGILLNFDLTAKDPWSEGCVYNLPTGKPVQVSDGANTDLGTLYVVRKIILEKPGNEDIVTTDDPTIKFNWKQPIGWVKVRLSVSPYPSFYSSDTDGAVKLPNIEERKYSQIGGFPTLQMGGTYRFQATALGAGDETWTTSTPNYVYVQKQELSHRVKQDNQVCKRQLQIIKEKIAKQNFSEAIALLSDLMVQAPANTYQGVLLVFKGYCLWASGETQKAEDVFKQIVKDCLPCTDLAQKLLRSMETGFASEKNTISKLFESFPELK